MTNLIPARGSALMAPLTEYEGAALEEAIRDRIRTRSWYRQTGRKWGWLDLELVNTEALRVLFAVRREAIRNHAEAERITRRQWMEPSPYEPVTADPGDIFVYPNGR